MTPARRSSGGSRRNSSDSFKPYTRCVTPIVVSSISDSPRLDKFASPACVDHSDTENTPTNRNDNLERPGFPTYAQYKQVERAYLQCLTPRRQGKALISQAMFDRIWDVLHQELPESSGETAQFRFWARKMFTVSKTHRVTLGVVDHADDTPQEVLLHDNLLVAIQEQLYDLLCYCHGSTGHGGRDKTCALIRKHYTWVPKDLVSNFIKACPTCILKKCGSVDSAAAIARMTETARVVREERSMLRDLVQPHLYFMGDTPSPSTRGSGHALTSPSSPSCNSIPWPTTGGPRDGTVSPSMLEDVPFDTACRQAISRARGSKTLSGVGGSGDPKGLQIHLMSREVSLYKGLPNGWQYRHNDYASAHAEFMRTKDLPDVEDSEVEPDGRERRPRVPSVAPLWGPDNFPHPGDFEAFDVEGLSVSQANPNLGSPGSERREDGHGYIQTSRIMMHDLLMTPPPSKEDDRPQDGFIHQLDPMLLPFSGSPSTPEQRYERATSSTPPAHGRDHESSPSNLATATNHPSSSSIKRAAAPPRLNLDLPNEKTFQALLAYRDALGDGNVSPDSSMDSSNSRYHPGNPSPASSVSSRSSSSGGSFLFPMEVDSALTTPSNSALTTPVDECAGGPSGSSFTAEFVKGKVPEEGGAGKVDVRNGL